MINKKNTKELEFVIDFNNKKIAEESLDTELCLGNLLRDLIVYGNKKKIRFNLKGKSFKNAIISINKNLISITNQDRKTVNLELTKLLDYSISQQAQKLTIEDMKEDNEIAVYGAAILVFRRIAYYLTTNTYYRNEFYKNLNNNKVKNSFKENYDKFDSIVFLKGFITNKEEHIKEDHLRLEMDKFPNNLTDFILENVGLSYNYLNEMTDEDPTGYLTAYTTPEAIRMKIINHPDEIDNIDVDGEIEDKREIYDMLYEFMEKNIGERSILAFSTTDFSGKSFDTFIIDQDKLLATSNSVLGAPQLILPVIKRLIEFTNYISVDAMELDSEIKFTAAQLKEKEFIREYELDKRKACFVKSHIRRYKSGLVTLVRSHKRNGFNCDNNKVKFLIK